MDTNQILLETKLVSEIEGTFFVPSYQRGYRWGKDEVERLLDDIYTNGRKSYCLQPIVVRKRENDYELIDGQQRLTTLYLIYRYLYQLNPAYYDEPHFKLIYETRDNSAEYLVSMDLSRRSENIDFWFMANAYEAIERWFNKEKRKRDRAISDCFDEFTKIIWYEVSEQENAISLFTRLNIGKIPLTSAELVKALFLSSDGKSKEDLEKQNERSLQWDNIEHELNNDSLWYFLTNRTNAVYQTRIDLVLDLIAEKPAESREKYYTFFKLSKADSLDALWDSIQHTYLVLKDWFEDHELYHKIGYLIASEAMTLQKVFDISKGKKKQEFRDSLDSYIRNSIALRGGNSRNYADLSYTVSYDYKRISRLLLLFNVESVRRAGAHTQWFPFDKFKYDRKGKVAWSLEHIHAQQSEGLRTQELWKQWLELHRPSVLAVSKDSELISEIDAAINKQTLDRDRDFTPLQDRILDLLSEKGSADYLHSISNLALLRFEDNAALNNSTFDVKRDHIIEMDKEGLFIPFCTRMVFLKYYTESNGNQLHFWGQADRVAYIEEMNKVLGPYLEEPIAVWRNNR